MTSRFSRVITGATLVAVLALGGAGVANALTSDSADAGVAALTSDVATGSDDQRAAESAIRGRHAGGRPGLPGAEWQRRRRSKNGDQATTTEDADV